jgi:hypothetical protein
VDFTTWPSLTPFVLYSADQFRLDPPLDLASDEYAADFAAVKSLGAKNSTTRTKDQTDAANFWYEGGNLHFNVLARSLAISHGLGLSQTARLLALVNVAMADGAIAVMDTKYHYNFWRPIAAIRGADTDGNDATVADPTWDSMRPLTAAHPDYASQHAVIASAVATVLGRIFGDDTQFTLSTNSGTNAGVPQRTFNSFSQAAAENAESRVWLGWHFPTAAHRGLLLGQLVGEFVFDHAMQRRSCSEYDQFACAE